MLSSRHRQSTTLDLRAAPGLQQGHVCVRAALLLQRWAVTALALPQTSVASSAWTYLASGAGSQWSQEAWEQQLSITCTRLDGPTEPAEDNPDYDSSPEKELEFDIKGIDPAIANALRPATSSGRDSVTGCCTCTLHAVGSLRRSSRQLSGGHEQLTLSLASGSRPRQQAMASVEVSTLAGPGPPWALRTCSLQPSGPQSGQVTC